MRVITFKIDEKTLEQLDIFAIRHGITRSDAIRMAIMKLLREHNQQPQMRSSLFKIRRVIIA